MNNKVHALLEANNLNSSEITSALGDIGDGSMLDGIRYIRNDGYNNGALDGLAVGFMTGRKIGQIEGYSAGYGNGLLNGIILTIGCVATVGGGTLLAYKHYKKKKQMKEGARKCSGSTYLSQ